MVDYWHILIGGFHQRFNADNGLAATRSDLLRLYGRGPDLSDVVYLPWYMSADDYAGYIYRNGNFRSPDPPGIQIAGYSYGGQTAINLCRALQDLGVVVQRLCLIDPVRRRSRMPWGWLAAVNRWAVLEVPGNVRKLDWFFQSQSWPRSHNVEKHATTAIVPHKLLLNHNACDNVGIVRDTILLQAADIHPKTDEDNIEG